MAYISSAEVKSIRKELKENFKNLKFSVRKDGHSAVHVSIMSGDIDFSDIPGGKEYIQINHYWLGNHLDNYGEHSTLFTKILEIIKSAPGNVPGGREWYDDSDSMIDYFNTAFYIHMEIGQWNKFYELKS